MKSNTVFLALLHRHKRKCTMKKGITRSFYIMHIYSTLHTLNNKLCVPLLWRLAICSSLLLTLLLTGSLCFILLCRSLLLLLPFSRDTLSLLIHNILFQIKLFLIATQSVHILKPKTYNCVAKVLHIQKTVTVVVQHIIDFIIYMSVVYRVVANQ